MTYEQYRDILLKLARDSIAYGLEHRKVMPISLSDYPQDLQEKRASFVTLLLHKELRGCIGTLEALRPLARDVVHNAYASAFTDPRFMPLNETEFPHLEIHISILTPAEPMQFESEQDLLEQIQPGCDGLILEAEGRRGTFLPSVWNLLPDKQAFWQQLKTKACLPQDYWSDNVRVWRYHTEMIE